MSTISATVNWDEGGTPSVTPDPILVPEGQKNVTIVWSCGRGVQSFQILGLTISEFSLDSSPDGPTGTIQITDANDSAMEYSYTVVATHTSGDKFTFDPKIKNGS
jgi:hypothetical protein